MSVRAKAAILAVAIALTIGAAGIVTEHVDTPITNPEGP